MDIEDLDDGISARLSRMLRNKLGVRLFNRLRERVEASGVQDRLITLAVMTELAPDILSNQPVTLVIQNDQHKLRMAIMEHAMVNQLHTHGHALDGPAF